MFPRLLFSTQFDSYVPITSVPADLRSVKLSVKSTFKLGFTVTVEAKDGQIVRFPVTRIFINMVNLNRLVPIPTHATCPV